VFHNAVREHRTKAGLSQSQLSIKAGVNHAVLSQVELGQTQAYPKARRQLAKALGVAESQLFPEVETTATRSR
jgi:transcriptional regulator with XRE-family HTH domain